MPDLKISQLNNGNPAQTNDQIPINRAGVNFSITAGSIASLATVNSANTQILFNDNGTIDGDAALTFNKTGGIFSLTGQLNADNLRLDGNTLSTTNTNGNLVLSPNGTGVVQETVGGTSYNLASQFDVGSDANELPINQYLGTMAFMNSDQVVITPAATATPNGLGDMVFELTSNTALTIRVKGSDGTVRSIALTLT